MAKDTPALVSAMGAHARFVTELIREVEALGGSYCDVYEGLSDHRAIREFAKTIVDRTQTDDQVRLVITEMTVDPYSRGPGALGIMDTIRAAARLAGDHGYPPQGALVHFKFNTVPVVVNAQSDPGIVYRSWRRVIGMKN